MYKEIRIFEADIHKDGAAGAGHRYVSKGAFKRRIRDKTLPECDPLLLSECPLNGHITLIVYPS